MCVRVCVYKNESNFGIWEERKREAMGENGEKLDGRKYIYTNA